MTAKGAVNLSLKQRVCHLTCEQENVNQGHGLCPLTISLISYISIYFFFKSHNDIIIKQARASPSSHSWDQTKERERERIWLINLFHVHIINLIKYLIVLEWNCFKVEFLSAPCENQSEMSTSKRERCIIQRSKHG